MKITTRQVLQWNTNTEQYDLIEEDSHEWFGPVDEAKSGGGSSQPATTTQTTTSKPFPEQLPFVRRVFSEAQDLFNQGPQQFFPGETVAGFDPITTEAQNLQVNLARNFGGFLAPQAQAFSQLLQTPDPANDPTVQAFADAAVRPLEQQLTEEVLPALSSQAVSQGAFGGSRQDLLEQQAVDRFARTAGDVRAGIFSDAFNQQLQAQQRALALAPQFLQQLSVPAQLLSEVGAARENLAQQQIDADRERFDFQQVAPLLNLQNFSNLINQFGGSSSTGTLTQPGARRNPLLGAVSGAATGAGLASTLGLSGFGLPFAIGGGLLGLF